MEARMSGPANPDVITAIQHLYKAIHAGGADKRLLSLVHLRTSQIIGCSPCVFASIESAQKAGETDERLHNVVAWRETPFYTEEERAALALTEAATRLQDGAPGVTDEIWDAAADHFSEEQLNAIILRPARPGEPGGASSPRRRVAERTLGWLMHHRRLARESSRSRGSSAPSRALFALIRNHVVMRSGMLLIAAPASSPGYGSSQVRPRSAASSTADPSFVTSAFDPARPPAFRSHEQQCPI
ncbi:hypothetical protein GCM10027074_74950 [Streptomyces deserti]